MDFGDWEPFAVIFSIGAVLFVAGYLIIRMFA